MSQCTADFELGTNGATIGTGDAGSATAWDAVGLGTGCTKTYDTTHAAHGTKGCKFANGGSSGTNSMTWSTALGGTLTDHYGRAYVYITAAPGSPGGSWDIISTSGGGTHCFNIRVSSTGTLQVQNTAFATIGTSTNALNTNAWTRLEWHAAHASGNFDLKIFLTPDATNPDETVSATGQNIRSSGMDTAVWSMGFLNTTVWMDDLVAGATSYPGPVSSGATSGSATGGVNFDTSQLVNHIL